MKFRITAEKVGVAMFRFMAIVTFVFGAKESEAKFIMSMLLAFGLCIIAECLEEQK